MAKKETVDPREAILAQHASRHKRGLPPQAIEDLRWFCDRAAEGRELPWKQLAERIAGIAGAEIGRRRLATLAKQHGITPYWSS